MSEDFCPICGAPDGSGHSIICAKNQQNKFGHASSQAEIEAFCRPKPDEYTKSILQEADALVNGDRHEAYGAARDNFTHWRDMCQATGRPGLSGISAEDLAVVMICLKVCRNTVKYKRDSTVDGAAYFELWDQVKGL